jgi:hypothetical protein
VAPVVAAVALHIVPSYVNSGTFNDYLPVLFGVSAVTVAVLSNPRLGMDTRLLAVVARSRPRRGATRVSIRGRPANAEGRA